MLYHIIYICYNIYIYIYIYIYIIYIITKQFICNIYYNKSVHDILKLHEITLNSKTNVIMKHCHKYNLWYNLLESGIVHE